MKRHAPIKGGLIQRFVLVTVVSFLIALAGCSIFRKESPKPEPTLASLKSAKLPQQSQPLPQVSLQEVANNYREVLRSTNDPELRVQVTQRLADLQMLSGEQQQLAGKPQTHYYDETIKSYRDLLAKYPNRADNDYLLYQLSKACDLDGRTDESLAALQQLVRDYPNSAYYVEAQFRRGELLFARSDYVEAEAAYSAAVKKGRDSNYYQNAQYMQGWAQFKRASYEPALISFTGTLDLLWPEDKDIDDLARAQREIVNDTLRVMSLIFSYDPYPDVKGAQTITAFYAKRGERHYSAELYRQLGLLYLQQKRYRDAADTYRAYADAHPLSPVAPSMYVLVIAAYNEGNFPSEVLTEKGEFIKRYGIHSAYWAQADEPTHTALRENLKEYLGELAQYHHAHAQQIKALIGKSSAQSDKKNINATAKITQENAKNVQENAVVDPDLAKATDLEKKSAAQQAYRLAGNYYREYIDTFPEDQQVGRIVFLLAESRFEAEDYPAAIEAYEQAAYQYSTNERGADAGYSALLAYEEQIKRVSAVPENKEQKDNWQQLKIDSELRFAKQYAKDSRAVTVQAHAADELFERKDYPAAVAAAAVVLQWQPAAEQRLQRSSALIIGHGEFEQQHFVEAEQGYRSALSFMPSNDPQRAAVQERLAASVYKQGEQKLAGGDKQAAAQEFLRVAQVAPESSIRVNAQYDAATQFMEGEQWQSAISTLNDLRTKFPKHELSAGVATKLAVAYQQAGQPAAAAAELTRVAHDDSDLATRREALYSAAELYQKAGDNNSAIERYREYVQSYPQPFAQALEARYQVTELYKKIGASDLRKQWLQQIIEADATAGSARSDRSRFLAAQAQDEFAEDTYRSFTTLKLTLPLKDSLKRKKVALEQALAAYNRCADYGVQQFATKASYRIGEIYATLSDDIIKSERPKDLSDLEKEQYDVLLEEQSDPFVEKAIGVHEGNAQRSWTGINDEWVQKSFAALEKLLPARYKKPETKMAVSDEIR
jgi:outer membrane protein assembly factor BamD (BamD/ComL family)